MASAQMEVNKPAPAPEHVEMAQGDWAELLVHSDRVQKASIILDPQPASVDCCQI